MILYTVLHILQFNILSNYNKRAIILFHRILTPYEASSLVALLHTKDCEILERALVTVSNTAAFTTNQVSKKIYVNLSQVRVVSIAC